MVYSILAIMAGYAGRDRLARRDSATDRACMHALHVGSTGRSGSPVPANASRIRAELLVPVADSRASLPE